MPLVGEEVAIVTDAPGTTRDLLRQHLQLDGLPLNLTDTAGLRAANDAAEAEGIRRARGAMARADHILYVLDASQATGAEEITGELAALPPGVRVTLVLNKTDLPGAAGGSVGDAPHIRVSAKTGAGLGALRDHLKAAAGYAGPDHGAFSARRRHLDALQRARASIERAAAALAQTRAVELFAEDLRLAQAALGEITGEFTSDDLLGEIFRSFCIGK